MPLIVRGLAWLGRYATWILFAGVFLGLAWPGLAGAARPLLAPAVVILLTATLLRLDWSAIGTYARRPVLAGTLTLWLLVAAPVLVVLALGMLGLPATLTQAVALMAAAPPILASAALAMFVGLDGALAIAAALVATFLAPFTVPVLSLELLGVELDIATASMIGRLGLLVGTAAVAAALIRARVQPEALSRHAGEIDGVIVVAMLVFAVAIMDGVTATAIAEPETVALWLAAAFVANPALQAVGAALFAALGRRAALTAGLLSGNRNMGLLLATLPAGTAYEIQLYFALAQLPIFMLPALTKALIRRLTRDGA